MNVIPETVTTGNSGYHKTSIMSIPDECYSRNGYPGNSGDHNTSIMITYLMNVIPETVTQVIVVIIKLQ